MKTLKLLPKTEHWYYSEKKKVYYPSVTMVTSYLPKGKFFEKYLADQESYEETKRILQEAGERGTRVHTASEALDKGMTIEYGAYGLTDEEYALLAHGYLGWHAKYKPEIKHVELRLISDKHKLGGTLDRIYKIDGKNVLFDLKTSKTAIYDSYWIQVAAYADMYEELYKEKIDEVAILRLTERRKDGYEYITRERVEWQKDLKQFKKTYDTMLYLNGGKVLEPKVIEVPEELRLDILPSLTEEEEVELTLQKRIEEAEQGDRHEND